MTELSFDWPTKRVWLAYGALGLLLWPLPLLNVLQVESAAVVAFVSFFVAGWAAVARFRAEGQVSLVQVLFQQECALLIPLAMLLFAQLWAPNCTVGQGLLFYALFPGVTVVFAVGLAYAVTGLGVTRPYLVLGGVGLFVGLAGPIYDLGLHPQFYTYNHVFGGVLGPIYDEQLAVRDGLFVFRGLTLLWAVGAMLLGRFVRRRGSWWPVAACGMAIAGVYWYAVPLGLNTSGAYLQDRLGSHVQTAHFDIYFDSTRVDRRAIEALADDHEAHYQYVQDRLGLADGEGPARIQSYLYPNPDVKARLTGARYTSVSPVWLRKPQVHLLVDRSDGSLGHEIAHVFSRPYGLPLLHASPFPGLVEGWAVALEPPDPAPSPHDLVQVAATQGSTDGLSQRAEALSDRLTPWGFWTGRGAVSYATMGSFVQYLLETYGHESLKQVYATGRFEAVYDRSVTQLAQEWAAGLARRPLVSRAAHEVVSRQFTRPSLFEKDCPHYLPPHRRHFQASRRAARRGDSSQVDRHLHAALAAQPHYAPAHAALARRRLARDQVKAVRQQLDTLAAKHRPASLRLLQGDARARGGESQAARRYYEAALDRLPMHAHATRARVMLRNAVAGYSAVVRILTTGHSAETQARRLAELSVGAQPSVQAWRALRRQDAHQYVRADSLWQQAESALPADRPRSWDQTYGIQQRAWQSEAAYRADRYGVAREAARAGAQRAAAHGSPQWAETIAAWGARAKRKADAADTAEHVYE